MLCWIACGTVLGNKFWPNFLCRFVTANHRKDSAPETIPWCNLTQNRPLLTLYLKVAYSMDEQSERECEWGARGGEGGGGGWKPLFLLPLSLSRFLFLLFSDPHSLVRKQRIVRPTTADIFLNNYKGFDWKRDKVFFYISLCASTDLTCLFISPLWWRMSSRGKRTWRISVLVILSHARCSICTGSRLNVNWMSNFFLFIYGILDKIIDKNVSRKFISDKVGLSP